MTAESDLLKLDDDQLTLDADNLSLEDEVVISAALSAPPTRQIISWSRPANLSRSNR